VKKILRTILTWCRNIHISLETVHIIIADVILFFVILARPVFVPIALGNGSYKKVCGFCTIYAWLFSCHVIQARVLFSFKLTAIILSLSLTP
jgi:hypothetical protein